MLFHKVAEKPHAQEGRFCFKASLLKPRNRCAVGITFLLCTFGFLEDTALFVSLSALFALK